MTVVLPSFCMRPKTKDLGITRVVVVLVGFFTSKTHATSLSLSLHFYYFLSPYLYIILLNMSTYLHKPTYHLYLPISTYLLTFDNLPTYTNLPTPINLHQHTYLPMSSYQHIPTHANLLSST